MLKIPSPKTNYYYSYYFIHRSKIFGDGLLNIVSNDNLTFCVFWAMVFEQNSIENLDTYALGYQINKLIVR